MSTCFGFVFFSLASRGFPVSLLPDICMAGTSAGMLAGNWHGIEVGTDVKVAMGDFQCAVFSSCADTTTAGETFSVSSIALYQETCFIHLLLNSNSEFKF